MGWTRILDVRTDRRTTWRLYRPRIFLASIIKIISNGIVRNKLEQLQNLSLKYIMQLVEKSSPFCSLRTDTQITFSLHFTPLGIRLASLVA